MGDLTEEAIASAIAEHFVVRDGIAEATVEEVASVVWRLIEADRRGEAVSAQHAAKAERLMVAAKNYRRSANDPDAAGSAIRAGWARHADALMAEAQVEASLANAKRGLR